MQDTPIPVVTQPHPRGSNTCTETEGRILIAVFIFNMPMFFVCIAILGKFHTQTQTEKNDVNSDLSRLTFTWLPHPQDNPVNWRRNVVFIIKVVKFEFMHDHSTLYTCWLKSLHSTRFIWFVTVAANESIKQGRISDARRLQKAFYVVVFLALFITLFFGPLIAILMNTLIHRSTKSPVSSCMDVVKNATGLCFTDD